MVNVSNKGLKEAPVANVAAALQGLATGVDVQMAGGATHPGALPQIRIRGERSINGGNDALRVLDGIPFSGNLNDISNNDVESISILKDASATAIYGMLLKCKMVVLYLIISMERKNLLIGSILLSEILLSTIPAII
jgi:outer membrane receptor protein involved in Fe transport